MRVLRIHGPRDLRLVDLPTPDPGKGQALCRVLRAGICATDQSIYTGRLSFVKSGLVRFPFTPGHEWSGVVKRVGPGVQDLKPGDAVVGDTAVSCGVCRSCLLGSYNACSNMRSVGTVNAWDGAFADCILMPQRHLSLLPAGVSFDNGAMVEPAATALNAVYRAQVGLGDRVLVLGSGPIGIIAAKLAKLCGAWKVVLVGRRESKLRVARSLGIDATIDTGRSGIRAGVSDALGTGMVDSIVEASGSVDLLNEALGVLSPSGLVGAVAFYEGEFSGFDLNELVLKAAQIRGVAGSMGLYEPILRLMESGRLDLAPLITSRCTLDEVPRVMHEMDSDSHTIKMMIGIDYSGNTSSRSVVVDP